MAIIIRHTTTGDLKWNNQFFGVALARSAEILGKEAAKYAQEDYMKKRISTDSNSLVFSAISYSGLTTSITPGNIYVRAIVSVDTSKAPHAIYVHDDHPVRGKKRMWSATDNPNAPYKFLDAGIEHVKILAPSVIITQINSIMR